MLIEHLNAYKTPEDASQKLHFWSNATSDQLLMNHEAPEQSVADAEIIFNSFLGRW